MNLRLLVVCSLAASSALAADGLYRWTDESGEVHYTNDLGSLPGDVVVTPVESDEVSVIKPGAGEPKKVAPPRPTRDQLELAHLEAKTRQAVAEADLAELKIRKDARDEEDYWRETFRAARRRIQVLTDSLEEARAEFQVNGLPITMRTTENLRCGRRFGCAATSEEFQRELISLKALEREVSIAETELRDLERRASYLAIPREWRE